MSKTDKSANAVRESWMTDEMIAQIGAASRDGKIPCAAAQQFARENGLAPDKMKNLLDVAGLKVKSCQLGCF